MRERLREGTLIRLPLLPHAINARSAKSTGTMAELMAIADEYATADTGMTNPIRVDEAGRVVLDSPTTRKGRVMRRLREELRKEICAEVQERFQIDMEADRLKYHKYIQDTLAEMQRKHEAEMKSFRESLLVNVRSL